MSLCPETPIINVVARDNTDEQVKDMWYDWFCKDTSLVNKGRRLLAKLRSITPSPRFDATKTYVWFKNNCPVDGSLYDDFRIAEIGTGDVVYCVVPAEGYTRSKGEACVWGRAPDTGEFGELVRGTWKDIKAFFREPDAKVVMEMIHNTRWLNTVREAEWEERRLY